MTPADSRTQSTERRIVAFLFLIYIYVNVVVYVLLEACSGDQN